MVLDYYTYTSGAVVQKALNAVAVFFATNAFGDYLRICIMLGLLITTATFMLSRNPRDIGKWMAVYTLVPLLLINMKATVLVVDKTEPGRVYNVDNVPYLVALPGWFFSGMMAGFTEGVESIYTRSDDERYGRTGMLFGSELYQLSRQASVRTAELSEQWNDYFDNCLYLDERINNKFTWDELFGAEDIFAFLDTIRQSPLRGMYIQGTFQTCAAAYPVIKQGFEAAAGKDMTLLAQHLWGKNATRFKSQTDIALQRSYRQFVQLSRSASNILKQNMVMNAIRYSIDSADPTQSALNYAYTANKLQTTSMWASLGLMAKEYLPMLQTIMFLLFSCSAFFTAGVAMLPGMTVMVLKSYAATFFYLGTWPMLFAILNAIQIWGLEQMSDPIAGRFSGLALSNANALDELHSRFSYMTGILMMSVPVIAAGLLKGGSAVLSNMNYQLAGMINATNARATAAASSGNMDFGNLQMDNHSFNNTAANKFDDNTLTNTGHNYTQNTDGSITTQHADGRTTYNATPAVSQANFQMAIQQSMQQGMQDNLTHTQQSLEQQSMQLSHNINTGLAQSDRWGESLSQSQSYGSGHSNSTEGQILAGYNEMQSAVNSVSQATGWSQEQSQAYLHATSLSANAGLRVGGKGSSGLLSMLNAGVNASSRWSAEDRDSFSKQISENQQALAQATQQYTQGASTVTSAAEQIDNKKQHSDVEHYAKDFAVNYQDGKHIASQAAKSESDMLAYSQALTRMESDSASFTQNHLMGFQHFLENQELKDSDIQRLMTAHRPEDLQEVKDRYGQYIQTEAFKELSGVSGSKTETEQAYQEKYDSDKPVSHPVPEFTPMQTKLMQAASTLAELKADTLREQGLAEHTPWEHYDEIAFQEVTQSARHQQSQAEQQTTRPVEQRADLTLKEHVEQEVGQMKDTTPEVSYTLDQSYPVVSAYTYHYSTDETKSNANSSDQEVPISLANDPNHGT
ncbi:conjugal transfer mating-pair stabilization protein TraG [Vibrio europaeus]|uniref:Conjugal transfer mating pair stabilization protein TraG n=1 Tax=Vibrio europaeus TaxID=300876 RepID=A0ABT5H1J2_9VIBR|nr:conjugal transfer mating-pair stabilization protein TraG [Vibrio europaeus]MDC5706657.1 conjugal transfer mating pair stabilization protein TraG [Vibrio europaeus]MDC5711810.1 conjugal transfer mating pair stabilization protein TraG [Vibrio europaeus]MDC5716497.1 conjugal transfer mating pair stabilization protein TraG [Vibrio europaeus]MDC5725796.1 conjugal transfer mating pair stabilization protein TraG [Vibrio europaeus]MDC5732785.1 conjugal transfer mating pair stabilization protein Tra